MGLGVEVGVLVEVGVGVQAVAVAVWAEAVSVACCSGESPQAESNTIRQIRQATGFMCNLHKI